jgi:hypothetical protein
MAVEDKYVESNAASGDKTSSKLGLGVVKDNRVAFEVAAADDDGSVYRAFKAVPVDVVITKLLLSNDAITAATDYEIGFYETDTGDAIDIDILLGTTDISAGTTDTSGLGAVDIANRALSIKDLIDTVVGAGTVTYPTVDVAITANTVGSTAGTIFVEMQTK